MSVARSCDRVEVHDDEDAIDRWHRYRALQDRAALLRALDLVAFDGVDLLAAIELTEFPVG